MNPRLPIAPCSGAIIVVVLLGACPSLLFGKETVGQIEIVAAEEAVPAWPQKPVPSPLAINFA